MGDARRQLRDADSDFRLARERRLQAIVEAAAGGLTHDEIAEELGVTRSAVSQLIRAERRRARLSQRAL